MKGFGNNDKSIQKLKEKKVNTNTLQKDKLHHYQMCQRLTKTLECDSKSLYTKLALIDYFFFLFPPGKESINYYGNEVTDIRLLEGGLLDDWDFDEFDISDF